MLSNKRLTALLSCFSSVLTTTLLLLQLYGALIIKIAQQQRQLSFLLLTTTLFQWQQTEFESGRTYIIKLGSPKIFQSQTYKNTL